MLSYVSETEHEELLRFLNAFFRKLISFTSTLLALQHTMEAKLCAKYSPLNPLNNNVTEELSSKNKLDFTIFSNNRIEMVYLMKLVFIHIRDNVYLYRVYIVSSGLF